LKEEYLLAGRKRRSDEDGNQLKGKEKSQVHKLMIEHCTV
jgi:hypothetical protein